MWARNLRKLFIQIRNKLEYDDELWPELLNTLESRVKAVTQTVGAKKFAPCSYTLYLPATDMADLDRQGLTQLFADELAKAIGDYIRNNHLTIVGRRVTVRMVGSDELNGGGRIEHCFIPDTAQSSISSANELSDCIDISEQPTIEELADKGETTEFWSLRSAPAYLEIIDTENDTGMAAGHRFYLTTLPATIGRHTPGCHSVVDIPSAESTKRVSRNHALIEMISGQFVLRDLKSKNGTYINDMCIEPGASVVLAADDRITLADSVILAFHPQSSTDDQTTTGDPLSDAQSISSKSVVPTTPTTALLESLQKLGLDIADGIERVNEMFMQSRGRYGFVFRRTDRDASTILKLSRPAVDEDSFVTFVNALRITLMERTTGEVSPGCSRMPRQFRYSQLCRYVNILRNSSLHLNKDPEYDHIASCVIGRPFDRETLPYLDMQIKLLGMTKDLLAEIYEFGVALP